jgi:NAD(P)-dependent dehydrogenase (short-subunit alcohol dehydrogenase family)
MGKSWTVAEIPPQVRRRALITGANSGIGYYTALELARKGAHVLLGCRNKEKGNAALARLKAEVPQASAEVVSLDLASLESIRRVAEAEALGGRLDLLINNAGVMAPKKRLETVDGLELQFGTNVVGHFALTALLLPALERAAASGLQRPRVITIASIAHKQGQLSFDDLQSETLYSPMGAYRQSKLGNLMFAMELARRLRAAGPSASRILSVAAHPGVANTPLFQTGEHPVVEKMVRRAFGVLIGAFLNTDVQGAVPTLYAATAPDVEDGRYYGPQGFQEMRGGDVGPAQVSSQARDAAAAARLWSECERLSGIEFLEPVQQVAE